MKSENIFWLSQIGKLAEYSSLNIWPIINIKDLNGKIAFKIQNNVKNSDLGQKKWDKGLILL